MKWHHLRMDVREYERLDAFRRTLESRVRSRPDNYPKRLRDKRLSTGDTIGYLLDVIHRENVRHKRPRKNRACVPPGPAVESIPVT